MPQKRGSNAARGNRAQQGGASGRGQVALQNDMAGVALAVLALALLVAIVSPGQAPVTSAVHRALTYCFGTGALLCPITLFIFALTFFVEGEEPFGTRAALGLTLVFTAVLSLVSLYVPDAQANPSIVLDGSVAPEAGGYLGGAIAWLLLSLVGRAVGVVLLVGLAVVGAIVCGFSVSGFVVRMRLGAERMREVREAGREQRRAWHAASARQQAQAPQPAVAPAAAVAQVADAAIAATTFIGSRTTSVLTRNKGRRLRAQEAPSAVELVPTEEEGDRKENGRSRRTAPRTERRATRSSGAVRQSDGATRRQGDDSEGLVGEKKPTRTKRAATAREGAGAHERTPRGADARPHMEAELAPTRRRRPAAKRRLASPSEDTLARERASAQSGLHEADDLTVPAFLREPTADGTVPAKDQGPRPGDGTEGYELPPMSLLSFNPHSAGTASSREELEETMARLQSTLHEFGLTSRVVDYISGPIVTTFRIEMGEGERVSRIRNLEDDIALNLAAEKVRIFAPVPGTSFVGIEIPNKTRQNVHLGDVLPEAKGGPLEVAIGRDSSGRPVVADIAKMPHMLVAGTTGSGKSVMINSMIMSLLMRTTPKQVRLIMIDPKRVEFSCYNGLPHLYVPVVTEPRQAASALQWAVSEMERRLREFEKAGAREIKVYNRMVASGKFADEVREVEPMPYLVVIIDELSDLMMVAGKDVEASIVRIAQLARAAGIHLVIATQRPSANVVTGLIKSNIDNRVALKVATGIDSRVILDETGAERLLGNGDMLFRYRGLNMQRVLGCYTSDNEINEVVDFIRAQAEPDYHEEILTAVVPGMPQAPGAAGGADEDDPLVWEAAQIVVESRLGSTSGLQRRLKVGYARAGRIMDMLEAKGVVGPGQGSKPREVLLDEDGLEELRQAEAAFREV